MAIDPTLKHPVQMFDHDAPQEPVDPPMTVTDYYKLHFGKAEETDLVVVEDEQPPPIKGSGSKP